MNLNSTEDDQSTKPSTAFIVRVLVLASVLGLCLMSASIWLGLSFALGLPPFSPQCMYVDETGEWHDGCPAEVPCVDGECMPAHRGL